MNTSPVDTLSRGGPTDSQDGAHDKEQPHGI